MKEWEKRLADYDQVIQATLRFPSAQNFAALSNKKFNEDLFLLSNNIWYIIKVAEPN